jgi:hypothetical protein
MTPAADNLIALYQRNDQAAADIAWYANAKRLVRSRAQAAGLPWRRYAAVVAATSPMQQWSTKDGLRFPNLDAADRVIAWHRGQADRPMTLPTNAAAAARILDGGQPTRILGPKTRRFYLALTGRDTEPVLDRWALRAIGWPRETIKEREFDAAAAPYFEAADHLNITPAALQAATWTQIRREA